MESKDHKLEAQATNLDFPLNKTEKLSIDFRPVYICIFTRSRLLKNVLEGDKGRYRSGGWNYCGIPGETRVFLLGEEENGQFQGKYIK